MNPFTKHLGARLKNRKLKTFIHLWGVIERLVVDTYRVEGDMVEDPVTWRKVRKKFMREYPRWELLLKPYWQPAQISGVSGKEDPFRRITAFEELQDFKDNWAALQVLPAAREALNKLLLSLDEGEKQDD